MKANTKAFLLGIVVGAVAYHIMTKSTVSTKKAS